MHLKRLEIQGFKSFAERVEIEFEKGVTVVVGPNGCGKSNLTDAVQWVLGEQSARTLRGYRMDDVIFSGAAGRRPLGMAEVSLTFDNSEKVAPLPFEEINITRRVYRSGEGEYFINKRKCRLRDIQELFAQCGISRAAFSITAQGRIDEFVAARPLERRVFLEEIAGISSYRQRKAESLRKLQETEDALKRLQDLLYELENRRIPLEEQARVARLYNRLQKEISDLERSLLVGQLAGIGEKEKLLQKNLYRYQAVVDREEQLISLLEGELDELHDGLQARIDDIDRKEAELQDVHRLKQETTFKSVRIEEKLAASRRQAAELQTRFAVVKQKREETFRELEEIAETCNQLKVLQEQAASELEVLREENRDYEERRSLVSQGLESLDKSVFDVLHQKTALLSDIQGLRNKKELLVRQRESLNRKVQTAKESQFELEKELRKSDKLRADFADQFQKMQENLGQAEETRRKLVGEMEKHSLQVTSLLQKMEGLKERSCILKEAEKNREGYQQGVRSILKGIAQGDFTWGDLRLVEELFTIDQAYETALEIALGGAAHYFICPTPKIAKQAIDYLKRDGRGRASFLPLTAVDRWMIGEKQRHYSTCSGIIGRLSEVVSCEEKYRGVAEFFLGRTYLAEDLRAANFFAEDNNYRVRVVTLSGEIIQSGGLFTGGRTSSRYPSTRRRKVEIERIDEEIFQLHQKLQRLRDKQDNLKSQIEKIEEQVVKLQESCHYFQNASREEEQRVASLQKELKQVIELAEAWALEAEEQVYQVSDLDRQIIQKEQELAGIEEQEKKLAQKRAELEKERNSFDSEARAALTKISAAQVKCSSLSQELKHQLQKYQQLQHLLALQDQEQQDISLSLRENAAENNKLCSQVKGLSQKCTDLEIKSEEIKGLLTFRKKQVASRQRFVRVREKRCHKLRQNILQHKQQWENTDLKLKHLLGQKEQLLAYMEEHQLNLAEGEPTALNHSEELAIRKQIAIYKQKMEKMGDVNFTAPEEYATLQDRISYLLEQKKDLEKGKRSLNKLICEMNKIAVSRFDEIFQMVRKNFQNIFQKICDGGKADLVLTDEANLLETGVDIVVLPRGKKPRHLSLLSGGEKALTGISFLFAMLQAQPAPFYFLDEIEASLDEANLARFANYLKEWSASSQLILISHRYQTMQIADYLYGVTMEEPGVSKLVSVQLAEYLPAERKKQIS